ncbi:hypothetical protein Taro_037340 [Colocasia esculenta]|uniref:Uncharacterized protein n=1 Tax=Colocasia esculenta TaxID=4460 RepID=A0A843W5G2_COLES|nr:hypothetical protein [Colocasia esculenta]
MAEVIIERMKFATAMIWDKKNKLNVSLPYDHLLTRIFQHYNIDFNGEVSEKMGQAIRSRNLKKSGFYLVARVWIKTSVAEEAEAKVRVEHSVIEVPATPVVLEEAATVGPEEPVASPRRIEEIPPDHIEPVGQSSEVDTPTTVITSVLHEVLAIVASIQGEQEEVVSKVVAPGHSDVHMEDAPAQGEHVAEMAADVQGKPAASPHVDQFQEGVVESTSDEDEVHVDNVELVVGANDKGKGVATAIPLLTRKAHRRSRKKKIHVHLNPVIERLDAQGQILCSVQSDISSIFISQSIGVKEMSMMKAVLRGMKNEMHRNDLLS